jgi:hypothetical protein
MRTTQEILADLRHTTEWSQPNIKYNEFITLINELEEVLSPKTTSEKAVKEETVEPTKTLVEEVKVETVVETVESTKTKSTSTKK